MLRDDNKGSLRDNKDEMRGSLDSGGKFAACARDDEVDEPRCARDDELCAGLVMRSHLLTTMMTERPDSWA